MNESFRDLRVASPCPAKWEEMSGDDRSRFCRHCRKNVHNLSAYSPDETAALIAKNGGDVCVRFYRRADGTVLLGEDCPVGLLARQWKNTRRFAGALVSMVLGVMGTTTASAGEPLKSDGPAGEAPAKAQPTMGRICLPSPTPKPTPESSK